MSSRTLRTLQTNNCYCVIAIMPFVIISPYQTAEDIGLSNTIFTISLTAKLYEGQAAQIIQWKSWYFNLSINKTSTDSLKWSYTDRGLEFFRVTSVIMELVVKFLYRFLNINIPGISQSMELTTAKDSFRSNFTLIISYDRSVFQCWDLASNKVFWNVSMTGY